MHNLKYLHMHIRKNIHWHPSDYTGLTLDYFFFVLALKVARPQGGTWCNIWQRAREQCK